MPTFLAPVSDATGTSTVGIAVGDFNGDGAVDLAYASSGGVTVVTNDNADYPNLPGAVTFRVTAPATTTSGSVLPMTVTAIDADGNVATGFRGVAYTTSSDPAPGAAAGYAFNPADAGIPYVFTAADPAPLTYDTPVVTVAPTGPVWWIAPPVDWTQATRGCSRACCPSRSRRSNRDPPLARRRPHSSFEPPDRA